MIYLLIRLNKSILKVLKKLAQLPHVLVDV